MTQRFQATSSLLGLALLLTGCGPSQFQNPSIRTDMTVVQPIIGGEQVTESDYAAVGALVFTMPGERSEMFCTGTLIAPDVVLTASHCLDAVAEMESWGAQMGFSLAADVQRLKPNRTQSPFSTFSHIIKHPHYRSDFLIPAERLEACQDPEFEFVDGACRSLSTCHNNGQDAESCINESFGVFMQACEPYRQNACNTDPSITCTDSASQWCESLAYQTFGLIGLTQPADIGLLFLDTPIEDVEPSAILHNKQDQQLALGSEIHIVGYGQQSPEPGAGESGVKMAAVAKLNEVGTFEIKVGGDEDGIQQCYGDSGGPAFMVVEQGDTPHMVLVGVTSRSYNSEVCDKGGINTRTDSYLDWVQNEMALGCSQGLRSSCEVSTQQAQTALIVDHVVTPTEGHTIEFAPTPVKEATEGGCSATHTSPAALPFWITAIFLWIRTLRSRREA